MKVVLKSMYIHLMDVIRAQTRPILKIELTREEAIDLHSAVWSKGETQVLPDFMVRGGCMLEGVQITWPTLPGNLPLTAEEIRIRAGS